MQQSKLSLGNARIKSIARENLWHQSGAEGTVRECHNQKNYQEVSQSKEHQESATIKSTSRKCHTQKGVPHSWLLRGSTTKNASRECYNSKYIKVVSQSKVLPGSVTIKYLRKSHHHKYYQGLPQSKVLSGTATGTATFKANDRECRNKIYSVSATNIGTKRESDL